MMSLFCDNVCSLTLDNDIQKFKQKYNIYHVNNFKITVQFTFKKQF